VDTDGSPFVVSGPIGTTDKRVFLRVASAAPEIELDLVAAHGQRLCCFNVWPEPPAALKTIAKKQKAAHIRFFSNGYDRNEHKHPNDRHETIEKISLTLSSIWYYL
jgi:hypothetical protein